MYGHSRRIAGAKNAGPNVRGIVQAAGAPQDSFTNHFACKKDLGLERPARPRRILVAARHSPDLWRAECRTPMLWPFRTGAGAR